MLNMIKRFLVILLGMLLLTVFSCASPRPWTKKEKRIAGFYLLGAAADLYTTERMLNNPNCHENNPALGEHPSDTELVIYFPVESLIVLGLSHYFPKLRIPLLTTFGVVSWGCAGYNHMLIEE